MIATEIDVQLDSFEQVLAARSPETARTYLIPLRVWARWLDGRDPNHDESRSWIDSLVVEGRLKNNTIATYCNALRRFWRWRGEPINIDGPGLEFGNEVKHYSVEQIRRMLELAVPLEKVTVAMWMDTGCRLREILELTVDDIDWANRILRVRRKGRKGGRRDQVPIITNETYETLVWWNENRQSPAEHPRLFLDYCSGNNWGQKSNWLRNRLIKLAARAGIEHFKIHSLRHSRAMQLIDAGVDIVQISELLGHTSIEVTAKVYTKRSAEEQRKALAGRGSW